MTPDGAVHVTKDCELPKFATTEAGALEVKLKEESESLWPSTLVTTTVIVPAVPGGAVTTIPVASVREVTVALIPPIVTCAPAPAVEKPVPVMVTDAPEISPIDDGEICVIEGGGMTPVGVVNVPVAPKVTPESLCALALK